MDHSRDYPLTVSGESFQILAPWSATSKLARAQKKICWRWWCHCYLAKPPFKEFIQPWNLEIMSSSLVMDSVACTSFSFDGFPPLTGLSSSSVVPCLFLALHVFRWAYGFTTGVPHWPQGFWKTGKNTKFGFVHDIRDVCCPTVSKWKAPSILKNAILDLWKMNNLAKCNTFLKSVSCLKPIPLLSRTTM